MDWLTLTLRLAHITLGALWVGMMAFTAFFLTPAARDAGPEGGTVMAALQRRGTATLIPVIALGALLSGIWLVQRVWGGMGSLMASPAGRAYGIGGAVSLVAFVLGVVLLRPAMSRAAALAESLPSVGDGEREARLAQIARLRARGARVGQVVAVLLLVAVGAMGIARYVG